MSDADFRSTRTQRGGSAWRWIDRPAFWLGRRLGSANYDDAWLDEIERTMRYPDASGGERRGAPSMSPTEFGFHLLDIIDGKVASLLSVVSILTAVVSIRLALGQGVQWLERVLHNASLLGYLLVLLLLLRCIAIDGGYRGAASGASGGYRCGFFQIDPSTGRAEGPILPSANRFLFRMRVYHLALWLTGISTLLLIGIVVADAFALWKPEPGGG